VKVRLSLYEDARAFLEVTGEMLYAKETVNNLMLGVNEQLISDPQAYENPFFATVIDEEGTLQLAAVMTPPHNIILAGGDDFDVGLPVLISYLQTAKIPVPGVIGPVHIAERFVSAWKKLRRQNHTINMRQRVYELRHVRMPPLPPGHFRIAGPKDIEKISDWLEAYEDEALGKQGNAHRSRARKAIENGNVFVWERSGEIVSMAMAIRPIAHSITISGVYTPPEFRRSGYASALVARLSQHMLDRGYHFVNLFTDLSNPVSNAIYKQIGYHPVCDFRMYQFKGKIT